MAEFALDSISSSVTNLVLHLPFMIVELRTCSARVVGVVSGQKLDGVEDPAVPEMNQNLIVGDREVRRETDDPHLAVLAEARLTPRLVCADSADQEFDGAHYGVVSGVVTGVLRCSVSEQLVVSNWCLLKLCGNGAGCAGKQ